MTTAEILPDIFQLLFLLMVLGINRGDTGYKTKLDDRVTSAEDCHIRAMLGGRGGARETIPTRNSSARKGRSTARNSPQIHPPLPEIRRIVLLPPTARCSDFRLTYILSTKIIALLIGGLRTRSTCRNNTE